MTKDTDTTEDPKALAAERTADLLQVLNAIRLADDIQDIRGLADEAIDRVRGLNVTLAGLYQLLLDDEPDASQEEEDGYHFGGLITAAEPDDGPGP